MKVSAITTRNFLKQPHFNGFYKKSSRTEYGEQKALGDTKTILGEQSEVNKIYYYPFADETKQETMDFINDNTIIDTRYPSADSREQIIKKTDTSVEVKNRLSFSEKDYEDYFSSVDKAKKEYEKEQDRIRQYEIRKYLPANALKVEIELRQLGLDNYVVKY